MPRICARHVELLVLPTSVSRPPPPVRAQAVRCAASTADTVATFWLSALKAAAIARDRGVLPRRRVGRVGFGTAIVRKPWSIGIAARPPSRPPRSCVQPATARASTEHVSPLLRPSATTSSDPATPLAARVAAPGLPLPPQRALPATAAAAAAALRSRPLGRAAASPWAGQDPATRRSLRQPCGRWAASCRRHHDAGIVSGLLDRSRATPGEDDSSSPERRKTHPSRQGCCSRNRSLPRTRCMTTPRRIRRGAPGG